MTSTKKKKGEQHFKRNSHIWARGGASQQFNNTLCHTCGRGQNFQLLACWKKALVGVESKHLKKAFGLKYIHRRADDVNRKQIVNEIFLPKFVFKFLNTKTYFGFLCDIFWISHFLQAMLHVACCIVTVVIRWWVVSEYQALSIQSRSSSAFPDWPAPYIICPIYECPSI